MGTIGEVAPRILLFGNSGAGKSTLARRLVAAHGVAHLDLDILAWLPGEPPERRPLAASCAELDAFVARQDNVGWVIEGCYADLLQHVAPRCTRMLFLDPGLDACLEHCRARPWEPHKYPDKAAQDANLARLLDWVRSYPTRTDTCSLAAHRALFAAFDGEKQRLE